MAAKLGIGSGYQLVVAIAPSSSTLSRLGENSCRWVWDDLVGVDDGGMDYGGGCTSKRGLRL
jgi:hypothetical protein